MSALAKRFFTWVADQRVSAETGRAYGLKASPADSLKPGKIIGKKRKGDRILTDNELFALWRPPSVSAIRAAGVSALDADGVAFERGRRCAPV